MKLRRTILGLGIVVFVATGATTRAQLAPRRAASPATLLAYPGFYQGQLVVVRGNLVTRDQPVLLSPDYRAIDSADLQRSFSDRRPC